MVSHDPEKIWAQESKHINVKIDMMCDASTNTKLLPQMKF